MTIDWIDAVVRKSGAGAGEAASILTTFGITGPRPIPSRRRLRVRSLHFAGVKNLKALDGSDGRDFIPFAFSRAFGSPVIALVSDGKNDAGKSSTLEILTWGLRGRSNVPSDVQHWLRQVVVQLDVEHERVVLAWKVVDGEPLGQILSLPGRTTLDLDDIDATARTAMDVEVRAAREEGEPVYGLDAPAEELLARLRGAGAYVIASFSDAAEMETAVGDFMMNRLGLEPLTQWRRNPGGTDADDGSAAQHGWPLWSQALFITKPSITATIGETPNQAVAVLNTFLATEWSATRNLARSQRKLVDAELSGVKRRATLDAKIREDSVLALREEKQKLQVALDVLPPSVTTAEEATRLAVEVRRTSAEMTRTERALSSAAIAWGNAERDLHSATHELAALREAAVTRRFWHSLKPSCCPRCEAEVDQEQWEREQEGSCSLCNHPIDHEPSVDESSDEPELNDEENVDPVVLAEERVRVCAEVVQATSDAHEVAKTTANDAKLAFDEASSLLETAHHDPGERDFLERQILVLETREQERIAGFIDEGGRDDLELESAVLAAAEGVAKDEAKQDFDAALESVSAQIAGLGLALGISNLEKATLKGNAQLPVLRGGEVVNFSGLTDGERLRLKIALVIALLDVGAESGLGRHPGLLIVDSLLREELNEDNARHLLRELSRVAEAYGLQVLTGTTHSELVASVLEPSAIVRPNESGFMW